MSNVKKALKVYITPETHWDREWYLPFQSYRAKLVILIDRLLDILKNDPHYANFTLDGQSVVLQDYLEVRPEKEAELKKYIKEGRISVGPMYILPDEYLVSGEAIIRNCMLGVKISRQFGKSMNAAYIPDPFGHIAQLPQIVAGFDLPAILFARGFGNEFDDLKLDIEFIWEAPANAASVIGVHLIVGYGSVAGLPDSRDAKGNYEGALKRCQNVVDRLAERSCTGIVPLNNGSDHLFAQPFISTLVEQWNRDHADCPLQQADFGTYAEQLIPFKAKMKHFSGELHGSKYQHVLSGVYSARMWIKQTNMRVQTLLERYAEPAATLNWLLSKNYYPQGYLWTAWQALLRNHPHDSICGCSVDEVHDVDMKARFFNAEGTGMEVLKESLYQIASNIPFEENKGERMAFMLFNPLPWDRTEMVRLTIFTDETVHDSAEIPFRIVDEQGNEYPNEIESVKVPDHYTNLSANTFELRFVAKDVPACGYKCYYVYPGEETKADGKASAIASGPDWIENEFYRITIHPNGSFKLIDKKTNRLFDNLGVFEDTGDWGDEYDYSGPKAIQKDTVITSNKAKGEFKITKGLASAVTNIVVSVDLPRKLSSDKARSKRAEEMIKNRFEIALELSNNEPSVKIRVKWDNMAGDHRLRLLFPTGIKTETVSADGHFYVLPRSVKPPKDDDWIQKWQPTHHQNKFVSVADGKGSFTVMNKGLPEYEGKVEKDGSVTLAITLLRCIEWLSRPDFASRPGDAGPALFVPGAQCYGSREAEIAITTGSSNWRDSNAYRIAEQYVAPLQVASPQSIGIQYRIIDAIPLYFGMHQKGIKYDSMVKLPLSLSFLKLNNASLQLTAFKKAENEDALIIRLLNIAETSQTDTIKLYSPVKSVELVNMNEEKSQNPIKAQCQLSKGQIKISMDPWVLATLKIKF